MTLETFATSEVPAEIVSQELMIRRRGTWRRTFSLEIIPARELPVRSFAYPLVRPLVRSFARSFVGSFAHPFACSFAHPSVSLSARSLGSRLV